jgi:t-SNARE complex subunit (syntaxin)
MQNIESTIVELGGIFQQLAHMVKEQEEMVERLVINYKIIHTHTRIHTRARSRAHPHTQFLILIY